MTPAKPFATLITGKATYRRQYIVKHSANKDRQSGRMNMPSHSAIVRRRRTFVHVVLRDLSETGDVTVPPWWVDEIQREFGGLSGFLAELSRQWWTAYAAHLDTLIELGAGDPAQAWADVTEQMPHLRAVLDSYA